MATSIGGSDIDTVQRYLLDASQFKSEIRDCAKIVQQQQREEKQLEIVRKELEKQTGQMTVATQAFAHAMGSMLTSAIGKAAGALRDLGRLSLEWEDDVMGNEQAIAGLRNAMGGMAGDLDLVRAKNRLSQGDYKLSTQELETVGKAAIAVGRKLNEDFGKSLDRVTDVVIKGGRGLKELGINVELAGTGAEKTQKVLALLEDRFGDMNPAAENANESLMQLKNSMTSLVGGVGASILSAFKNDFSSAAGLASTAAGVMSGKIDATSEAGRRSIEELRKFTSVIPGMGAVTEALEQMQYAAQGVAEDMALAAKGADLLAFGGSGGGADPMRAEEAMFGKIGATPRKKRAPGRGAGHKESDLERFTRLTGGGKSDLASEARGTYQDLFGEEERKAEAVDRSTAAYKAQREEMIRGISAMQRQYQEEKKLASQTNLMADAFSEMASGALSDFAGGIWNAADAALQGGDSFGLAMAKMVKSTLLGIATQSTVKAVFETAEGFAALARWDIPAATNAFTSAGIFAGVAAMVGGAGLMMSAGIGGGAGGGGGTGANAAGSTYRPEFGERKSDQPQKIVVKLVVPGNDPAALAVATAKLKAELSN